MSIRGLFRSLSLSRSSSSPRSSRASVTSAFSEAPSTGAPSVAGEPGSTKITLLGSSELGQLSSGQEHAQLFMASLKAPLFEQNPEDKRAPIDLCCVLDRSGSMAGENIELAKRALLFVLEQLVEGDAMAVVLYDTTVQVLFDFERISDKQKRAAKALIEGIKTKDMTNLSGGLLTGMDLCARRKRPSDICSVLLFTDGLANHGLTATPAITAEMAKRQAAMGPKPCTTFTFGFGTGHNQEMLRGIAEAGGGMYYYVADADKIPISFADCLGGLQSVVGQNITLRVEALEEGAAVTRSLNPKYRLLEGQQLPAPSATLQLGDMYSEERRDVIFEVRLPRLAAPRPEQAPCLRFTVSYFNVLEVRDEEVVAEVHVARPGQQPAGQVPNLELDQQRNRILVAEALQTSRTLADGGDLTAAKALITTTISSVEKSASSKADYSQKLVQELNECSADMKSREYYASEGAKKISRKEQAHYYQRSNKVEDSEIDFYETSSKLQSKKKAAFF